jgi:hypothetical protein
MVQNIPYRGAVGGSSRPEYVLKATKVSERLSQRPAEVLAIFPKKRGAAPEAP